MCKQVTSNGVQHTREHDHVVNRRQANQDRHAFKHTNMSVTSQRKIKTSISAILS